MLSNGQKPRQLEPGGQLQAMRSWLTLLIWFTNIALFHRQFGRHKSNIRTQLWWRFCVITLLVCAVMFIVLGSVMLPEATSIRHFNWKTLYLQQLYTNVQNSNMPHGQFGQSVDLHTLAETWTEVWGDEVGALAPKIFFAVPPPKNVTFGGDGGGLTVFVNFDI